MRARLSLSMSIPFAAFLAFAAVLTTATSGKPADTKISMAEARQLAANAEAEYKNGNYGLSADAYAVVIDSHGKAPRTFYNAACSAALAGRTEQAFAWLDAAFTKGWRDMDHLKQDDDLTSLHSDTRWAGLLRNAKQAEARFLATMTHTELRAELLAMMRVDQDVRSAAHNVVIVGGPQAAAHGKDSKHGTTDSEHSGHAHSKTGEAHAHGKDSQHATPESEHSGHAHGETGKAHAHGEHNHTAPLPVHGAEMLHADTKHTARLKEIVKKYGWPTNSMVGTEGALAAFLLAQHADADPAFQGRCLDLMKAAPEGEVSKNDLAYLTDRVLVNTGKKQLYGTQFMIVNGQRVPQPIADEANLDRRRAEAGMITMKEYREHMTGDAHDH